MEMSATACAILGLISWYVATLFAVAGSRLYISITQKKAANTFAPDGSDMPGLGQRIVRVHANCYENLPIFVALMLYAIVSGNTAITDPSAAMLLYARIAQSAVHLASTSVPAVFLRFGLFLVQVGIIVCWLWQLML